MENITLPRISIALTTFNGEKYLSKQLESICNQTIKPYEVIVCDDKSTDNTIKILKAFQIQLPLKIFVNEVSLGVNSNFEKAIKLCTGDYIAICDQDDVWFNNKLEILYNSIIKEDSSKALLVRSNCYKVSSDLSINYGIIFQRKEVKGLYKRFFKPNAQGAGMLFNERLKKKILPFTEGIHSYDFYIAMIAELIGKSIYVSQPLMFYRIHENNAVGISELLPIKKRILKAIKRDFVFYNPSSFITLKAIDDNNKFSIDKTVSYKVKNILMLNSNSISKWRKIVVLFQERMAGIKERFILSLKILLLNN